VLKEIKQLETEVHLGRIKIVGLRLLCSSLGFVEAVEVLVRADESHISGPTAGIEFQDFSGRGKAFVIVAQIGVDDAQIMGRYRSYWIVHTPADSQIAVTLPNIFRQVRVSLADSDAPAFCRFPLPSRKTYHSFCPDHDRLGLEDGVASAASTTPYFTSLTNDPLQEKFFA